MKNCLEFFLLRSKMFNAFIFCKALGIFSPQYGYVSAGMAYTPPIDEISWKLVSL